MRIVLASLVLSICTSMSAQNLNPVLMTVNGKRITRAEFEYSFNKNQGQKDVVENKTLKEYLPMFIDYRLKVDAAEKAKLDTLSSFKKEFLTYRDLQLTPYLIDTIYIDSVAYSLYDRTRQQLNGKDLLLPSHILIRLGQQDGEEKQKLAKAKIDSIYQLLQHGEQFDSLAQRYSQDTGSARQGGRLTWIGPGSTLPEFEEQAYRLNKGEYSSPFLTAAGYHIILMNDRKAFEPYEQLKKNIVSALKAQGINEASSAYRIEQIIAHSSRLKNREEVLDSVLQAHLDNPKLKYLVQEYHDGLLLYEISKRMVWDKAAQDTLALERLYKAHKKKYDWETPRFKGFVLHAKNKKALAKAIKLLKKYQNKNWKPMLRQEINKDSMLVAVGGPYLFKKGENPYVDHKYFKVKNVPVFTGYPYSGFVGKLYKHPTNYKDVQSAVLNDLQKTMMDNWLNDLRKHANYKIDEDVLKTVNNH